MNEQMMIDGVVRQWEADGRWARAKNGTLKYEPPKREMVATS